MLGWVANGATWLPLRDYNGCDILKIFGHIDNGIKKGLGTAENQEPLI